MNKNGKHIVRCVDTRANRYRQPCRLLLKRKTCKIKSKTWYNAYTHARRKPKPAVPGQEQDYHGLGFSKKCNTGTDIDFDIMYVAGYYARTS